MKCMVRKEICYCDQVEMINLVTKVSFVMFKKERLLPSNTANLALNTLENSNVFHRGIQGHKMSESFLDSDKYHPLYLYPSEDAEELSQTLLSKITKPINLIIPDGTWRQARKIQTRESHLNELQTIILPQTPKSIYPLRRQKFAHGLSTFEAMAYTLGFIEGKETQEKLMENFEIMIRTHLKHRVILEKEKPL